MFDTKYIMHYNKLQINNCIFEDIILESYPERVYFYLLANEHPYSSIINIYDLKNTINEYSYTNLRDVHKKINMLPKTQIRYIISEFFTQIGIAFLDLEFITHDLAADLSKMFCPWLEKQTLASLGTIPYTPFIKYENERKTISFSTEEYIEVALEITDDYDRTIWSFPKIRF